MLAGDCDAHVTVEEKQGYQYHVFSSMKEFKQCLEQCGLLDLGFSGSKFTWPKGKVKESLNRTMGSASWKALFPKAEVCVLPS